MSINCVHMLLDLLFKHITNVSVLLKGEIRCVKNVSIMSQFKIPVCSIWFYLLYLFIQYLKRIIHQSFVSTTPIYGDSRGIAGVRCWTITFWLSPQCQGSVGVITLGHLPCWDFLLCRVGQRAGLLPSACPHRAGLIPGLSKVKIIILAHPRWWGSSGYKWLVHKWHL